MNDENSCPTITRFWINEINRYYNSFLIMRHWKISFVNTWKKVELDTLLLENEQAYKYLTNSPVFETWLHLPQGNFLVYLYFGDT